ncbi:N-acetyltransferase family protein [Candidatus Harpocratesius sp.]
MSEITITRYNPRKDKDELEQLLKDFEYRIGKVDFDKFSKEIEERSKDLRLRNSMILAKEDGKIVGAGFFSIWNDYLGRQHCVLHDVIVRKEHSFKKGIEEKIMRELFNYLKKTMKIEKVSLYAKKKGDSNLLSVLMKLGIKKSEWDHYEHFL